MTRLLCVISFEADFESFGHLDKTSVYVNAYYSRIILCLCLRISKFCQVELSVSLSFYDFFVFFVFLFLFILKKNSTKYISAVHFTCFNKFGL